MLNTSRVGLATIRILGFDRANECKDNRYLLSRECVDERATSRRERALLHR